MPDQIKVVIASPQNRKRKLFLLGFIILGIIIYAFYYFKIPFLTKTTQVQTNNQISLDNCNIRKEDNPLVKSISKDDNIVTGTFLGKVLSLTPVNNRSSIQITLASDDFRQKNTFDILIKPELIYDTNSAKLTDISALKVNQKLMITFNCLPKQGNLFKYDQINILKD